MAEVFLYKLNSKSLSHDTLSCFFLKFKNIKYMFIFTQIFVYIDRGSEPFPVLLGARFPLHRYRGRSVLFISFNDWSSQWVTLYNNRKKSNRLIIFIVFNTFNFFYTGSMVSPPFFSRFLNWSDFKIGIISSLVTTISAVSMAFAKSTLQLYLCEFLEVVGIIKLELLKCC